MTSKPFRIVDSLWRRALARRTYWDKYRLCREGLPLNDALERRRAINRTADKKRRTRENAEAKVKRDARLQLQLVIAPPHVVALCIRCRGPLEERTPSNGYLVHVKPSIGCKLRVILQQRIIHILRCACRCPAVTPEGRCALCASRARKQA